MVKELLDAGANPNHEWRGVTALAVAARTGDLSSVVALLQAGAAPNVVNRTVKGDFRTPLDHAERAGAGDCIRALRGAGGVHSACIASSRQ